MDVSNTTLWDAVEGVVARVPHVAVLGGGGYNPWTTIRCWAGLWGRLNGFDMPRQLPDDVVRLLNSLDSDLVDEDERDDIWFTRLDDPPAKESARQVVRDLVVQVNGMW